MKMLRQYAKYLPLFVAAVIIYALITNFKDTLGTINSIVDWLSYLLSRFAIGFGAAYFLNFVMRFFERRLKMRRAFALLTTYVILLGLSGLLVWLVAPAFVDSVRVIIGSLSGYYNQVIELTDGFVDWLPPQAVDMANETIADATNTLTKYIQNLLTWDYLGGFLGGFSRGAADFVFGLLISVYALWDKDKLRAGSKRLIKAILSPKRSATLLRVAHSSDGIFSRYIISKFLSSAIVGLLSLILFAAFRLPATPFLVVVAFVTNMIPYFGPIIGAVIIGVVEFGFGPYYALIGVLVIIGIQLLDGALIEPKIVGEAVGLSALLTLIAITIGGDLFGIAGIFFAAPIVGVIKNVFDELIDARLKRIPDELEGQISFETNGSGASPPSGERKKKSRKR